MLYSDDCGPKLEEVKINNIEIYLTFHRFSSESLNDLIAFEKKAKNCLGFKYKSTSWKRIVNIKKLFIFTYVYHMYEY